MNLNYCFQPSTYYLRVTALIYSNAKSERHYLKQSFYAKHQFLYRAYNTVIASQQLQFSGNRGIKGFS